MTADNSRGSLDRVYRRAYAIFDEACDLPFEQREPFVRAQAQGNREVEAAALGMLTEFNAPEDRNEPFVRPSRLLPLLETQANYGLKDGPEFHSDESHVGQVIAGKYRIDERLGRGGYGTVWNAAHVELGRRFAVKLLRLDAFGDPDARRRFKREAAALGILENPRIVSVVDYGISERFGAFLVMELLRGRSLAAELVKRGRLQPPHAIDIARQTLEALDAAHGVPLQSRGDRGPSRTCRLTIP